MRFGRSSLLPSYSRAPDFRSLESMESAYGFLCVGCQASNTVAYDLIIRTVSQWEEEWDKDNVRDAKNHFRIGVVGKSQDGGWPAMVIKVCEICGTRHVIYAGVNEVSNSLYVVTVQGITEILDE